MEGLEQNVNLEINIKNIRFGGDRCLYYFNDITEGATSLFFNDVRTETLRHIEKWKD